MRYHRNAKTNINQRKAIKESQESTRDLAKTYRVSHVTCAKWKKRSASGDASHTPNQIHYAVPKPFWKIIRNVRKKALLPLDDLLASLADYIPALNRSNCYRILRYYRLNHLSDKEKRQIRKFANYPPGYLHIDCFYLPRLKGERYYVYLAIDRATRLIFLRVYPRKNQEAAADFLIQALAFFPCRIHHILTDNGREFAMKGRSSFGRKAKQEVLFEIICELAGIKHRKTKAKHPWTNGMVERMVRTVKEHTVRLERYESAEMMIIDILHFQDTHNFQRRLKALNFKTPFQATMEWFVKEPKLFLKNPSKLLTIR